MQEQERGALVVGGYLASETGVWQGSCQRNIDDGGPDLKGGNYVPGLRAKEVIIIG